MKIAICFYGLVGSVSDKNGVGRLLDPKIVYDYYKKNIFNKNDDVDIFIHSYSVETKQKLIDLYNPVDYTIENQVLFPQSEKHPFLNKRIFEPEPDIISNSAIVMPSVLAILRTRGE